MDHFSRKLAGVLKPFCEEHDLGNHGVVRNHHANGSKQALQVIRKLCPASITRVHRDEDSEIAFDWQKFALYLYLSSLLLEAHSDREQLLGNH